MSAKEKFRLKINQTTNLNSLILNAREILKKDYSWSSKE